MQMMHTAGMKDLAPELRDLLDRQQKLIRRDQLLAHGVSPAAVKWMVRTGRWQRILTGIYATFTGALGADHRLVAAALHGGPDSQITGAAALRWHKFRYVPQSEFVHVLVPHTVRRNSSGFVVVNRTTRLDGLSKLRPAFQICSVARAVADAARASTDLGDVRACVAESVQRRLTTVRDLFVELDDGPLRDSGLLRRALADIAAGARSAPEADLRDVLSTSKILPTVLWNPRLTTAEGVRLPTPDGWIAEVGIALEVDSREYHLTPEGWQRTIRRHNLLSQHGALVLHFTPAQVRNERAAVLEAVERAYEERAGSGARFTTIRATPIA
jgi:hypothetical protein